MAVQETECKEYTENTVNAIYTITQTHKCNANEFNLNQNKKSSDSTGRTLLIVILISIFVLLSSKNIEISLNKI